jgi:acetyl-CoA carboxylase biotin carboxyl carrier protein
MTQEKGKGNGGSGKLPADLGQLKQLVDLMVENDLSRLELREGESHILLRRGGAAHAEHAMPATAPVAAPAPAANPAPSAPAEAAAAENETLIRSPMVGTFYMSPDPESPPFVSPGSSVGPDSVVCIVEAMKVFNEIKAECSGKITKVLVKNGQAVEFDQPLFAVAPE